VPDRPNTGGALSSALAAAKALKVTELTVRACR